MFCKNCGQTIDDNAVVCPHCGVQVAQVKTGDSEGNTMAIAGFVLFFLGFSFIGLILSIIGLKNAKNGAPYKGLAVAGIVLNALELCGYVILVISLIAGIGCAAASVGGSVSALCAIL